MLSVRAIIATSATRSSRASRVQSSWGSGIRAMRSRMLIAGKEGFRAQRAPFPQSSCPFGKSEG